MITPVLPYAIVTPVFRFRALAMHAGRASLGGDREIALACFAIARVAVSLLPPYMLASADAAARTMSTKQWLASLALAPAARAAAASVIDAVLQSNRKAAGTALRHLTEVASRQLDAGSIAELNEAVNELMTR